MAEPRRPSPRPSPPSRPPRPARWNIGPAITGPTRHRAGLRWGKSRILTPMALAMRVRSPESLVTMGAGDGPRYDDVGGASGGAGKAGRVAGALVVGG